MALLELLQPVLKSDADTSKFVDLFKSNVGGLPGIREHKAATVIKASGIDARKQGGTHFVVAWENLKSIENALKSPNLAALKEAAMPFVDEPPRPQLFRPLSSVENADEVLRAAFAQSAQFHLVKISAPESAWDDVKTRWDAFTQTVKEADGLTALFAGEGISHDEGVFLGLTGWANLGALERALRTADVAAKLEELEVAAGPDVSSTFIFDFNRDI